MRGFIVVWLTAFGMVTMMASGVTFFIARSSPPPTPSPRQAMSFESDASTLAAHGAADAIEIVSLRLPVGIAGDQLRRRLQAGLVASATPDPRWRVCVDDACWIAHAPSRRAEPENDAARRLEARPMNASR